MSSILDALKKVEEEKAAAKRAPDGAIDQDTAKDDLMGPGMFGKTAATRLSPVLMIGGILLFSVVLVSVSVGAAVYIATSQTGGGPGQSAASSAVETEEATPPISESAADNTETAPGSENLPIIREHIASAPGAVERLQQRPTPPPREEAAPSAAQPSPAVEEESPDAQEDSSAAATDSEPQEEEAFELAARDTAEPESTAVERADPEPAPSRERLYPREREPERETAPPATAPAPAEQRLASLPSDIRSLPPLTESVRRAHGLEDMRINMLRAPSENRPRPSALINYSTLYLGDRIPETNATLIAVEVHGIAIEVDGAKYFVRR